MGIVFDEGEREEYKEIILEMLGEADTVIARHIGVSNKTIIRWKKQLIAEGKTTEEAINEARKQKKEEAKKNDSNPFKVLAGLKEGKSKKEIGTELGIDKNRVKDYEDMLIENGLITREEIKEAREKRKVAAAEEAKKQAEDIQEIDEDLKDRILGLLNLGIDSQRLCNNLNISNTILKKIKKILIKEGKITEEQIRENKAKRTIQDKNTVLELLFKGYMFTEIAIQIPLGNRRYVERIVENLKNEGLITDEQIKKARVERKETVRRKIIIDGLKQGLTYDEIAEEGRTKRLTKKIVSDIKAQLVSEGSITESEIIEAKEKRKRIKREENKDKEKPDDEKIRKLDHLGFNTDQIGIIIGRGKWYIVKRRGVMEKKGIINRKGIRTNTKNRIPNAAKRLKQIERVISFKADLDDKIVQDQIDYEKAMAQLGETQLENIKLLARVIPMSSELVTPGNVNFVSTYLTRSNKVREALRFMDECIVTVNHEKDSMVRILNKGKEEIERHMKRQEEQAILVREAMLQAIQCKKEQGEQEDPEEGHGEH